MLGNSVFGNRILGGKDTPDQLQKAKPADTVRDRFTFFSTVLKQYAKFLQEVEGKDKTTVQQMINKIADPLIEQYSFGSKFSSELNTFIIKRFNQSASNIYSSMKENSGLGDNFDLLLGDMKESGLVDKFSTRFKNTL